MRMEIYVAVGGRWTVVGGLWQWTGQEDNRLMVVNECIPLRELHDRIYEKFEINKEEFNLKLSFCAKIRQTSKTSNVKDDEDLEAFLLGRTKNTIDTTLQVSKEPRVAIEGFLVSNDQSVNDLHSPADKLAHVEEEGVEEEEEYEEEDDEDEEVEDEEENDDTCLWHDPFLNRYNLEMEISDGCGFEMIQVLEGSFGIADEGSMLDLPLLEEVGSIPHNVVSGQTSDVPFPDRSTIEIN